MSDENYSFNSSVSPDGSTGSSETVTDETVNDEDITTLIAREENIFVQTTSINNDEPSIEMGRSDPLEVANSPIIVINNALFDYQPAELVEPHQQPTDAIPYLPSPINLPIAEEYQIELSSGLQIVPVHVNIPDDDICLIERETLAEHVQHEDDDIQAMFTERTPTQPEENPVHHRLVEHIDEIDLTQDDNEDAHEIQPAVAASPPIVDLTQDENEEVHEIIDLTEDNDEQEEVHSVQLTPDIDHINDNEQSNQSVVVVPIKERLPAVAVSPSEAADQNSIVTVVADNPHQTMETTAQLQVPVLLSRSNKRSSSSDEIRNFDKKSIADSVKRCRQSST